MSSPAERALPARLTTRPFDHIWENLNVQEGRIDLFALSTVVTLWSAPVLAQQQPQSKPNILFIMELLSRMAESLRSKAKTATIDNRLGQLSRAPEMLRRNGRSSPSSVAGHLLSIYDDRLRGSYTPL